MTGHSIHVQTELPTSAERVWAAMKHPASFLYVTHGLVGFPALAGRTDPIRSGEAGTGWVLAFNLIPAYRHTIEVLGVDEHTRTIRTHEHGGILRRWDHTLHVEPRGETRCRYATGIYRYRQRRWHRLVHKHLLPTGSRYSHPPTAPTGETTDRTDPTALQP